MFYCESSGSVKHMAVKNTKRGKFAHSLRVLNSVAMRYKGDTGKRFLRAAISSTSAWSGLAMSGLLAKVCVGESLKRSVGRP